MCGEVRENERRREELLGREKSGMTPDEELELALRLDDGGGSEPTRARLESILVRAPDHADTLFQAGRLMLMANDEAGVARLERAVSLKPVLELSAHEMTVAFYRNRHDDESARRYLGRLDQANAVMEKARAERNQLLVRDVMEPHGLDPAAVERIIDQLLPVKEIRRAHLARKQLALFPEEPVFVLAIEARVPWWKPSDGAQRKLSVRLAGSLKLPGEFFVLVERPRHAIIRNVRKIPGSLLLDRG